MEVVRTSDCKRCARGSLHARPTAAPRDRHWSLPEQVPEGWAAKEVQLEAPDSERCFAALFYGDRDEYLAYACVLGRRLRTASPGPDRVLLLGPGRCCSTAARQALRQAGWEHLLPVVPIAAAHLDKSQSKRHALVFTKLRVLELPYTQVLLLDLDLLPRLGVDLGELFDVPAPAAKYWCMEYQGPEPEHAKPVPLLLREGLRWSPNAGVMRLDPYATLAARRAQVQSMAMEVLEREVATFLPEQYYLAERLVGWRHISKVWNWEVWPEWDDPQITHPLSEACRSARRFGWAGYYLGDGPEDLPSTDEVLGAVRVWHFSGVGDTGPWAFQDLVGASEVQRAAAELFRWRDPGGVVASALGEWQGALDELLAEAAPGSALREAHFRLAATATSARQAAWACDGCGATRAHVRMLWDLPWSGTYCSVKWDGMHWACGDCIVARLRAADFKKCACETEEWHNSEEV